MPDVLETRLGGATGELGIGSALPRVHQFHPCYELLMTLYALFTRSS